MKNIYIYICRSVIIIRSRFSVSRKL